MKVNELISERLLKKLAECGMFKESIFSVDKMNNADRLYLDISTNGQSISYITKERLPRFGVECDYWNEDLRKKFAIQTKPGRVIQAINGSELPYSDQRKLRFMLFDSSNYEVTTVAGTDIAKYYNEDTYEEKKGDLGSSCMRYVPSSFFELYRLHCRMVVVMNRNTGKICARSIIFDDCKSITGMESKTILSKIYAIDDIFFDMIKNWAIDLGYFIFNGGYSASNFIIGHDEYMPVVDYKPYFPMDYIVYDELNFHPYVDNFSYSIEYYDREDEATKFALAPNAYYFEGYERRVCMHETDGGEFASVDSFCDGCNHPCSECWKEANGGWDYVGYNYYDDDYDEWDD